MKISKYFLRSIAVVWALLLGSIFILPGTADAIDWNRIGNWCKMHKAREMSFSIEFWNLRKEIKGVNIRGKFSVRIYHGYRGKVVGHTQLTGKTDYLPRGERETIHLLYTPPPNAKHCNIKLVFKYNYLEGPKRRRQQEFKFKTFRGIPLNMSVPDPAKHTYGGCTLEARMLGSNDLLVVAPGWIAQGCAYNIYRRPPEPLPRMTPQ